MNTKQLLTTAVIFSSILVSNSVLAKDVFHTGKVTIYHLNGRAPYANSGRGACVQTEPALPTKWACLYRNNILYQETDALLLDAYKLGKTCTLVWDKTDDKGFGKIVVIECK